MIDIKHIRENQSSIEESLKNKDKSISLDSIVKADLNLRELTKRLNDLQSEQNKQSKEIGILKSNKQISPLSGSIKEQIVTFIGKEKITISNKEYSVDHFKLISKNENLSNDKKLDFDVWYDPKNNIIIKVAYTKMGKWEYKLKNFE